MEYKLIPFAQGAVRRPGKVKKENKSFSKVGREKILAIQPVVVLLYILYPDRPPLDYRRL